MDSLPPEITSMIFNNLEYWVDGYAFVFACHQLFTQMPKLPRAITIDTQDLRPLANVVIHSPAATSWIISVTLKWQEYLEESSNTDHTGATWPTPGRIPLSGAVTPPAAFVSSCLAFLGRSGFEWRPEWISKLEAGSADTECCILLLALSSLRNLQLEFDQNDWDEKHQTHPYDFQHLFRHEMLSEMIKNPRSFGQTEGPGEYPLKNLQHFSTNQPYDDPFTINCVWPPCVSVGLQKVKGLFALPNLRLIELVQIRTGVSDVFSEEELYGLAGTTALETLKITRASLSADDLAILLSFPKALKNLHYDTTDPKILFKRHGEKDVTPRLTSPALLLSGLDRHKNSLERIHIKSINCNKWWMSDIDCRFHGDEVVIGSSDEFTESEKYALYKSRQDDACRQLKHEYIQSIDLHDFRALKVVDVHATDLLGSMDKEDASGYIPLSSVLPRSIENLRLRYSNYFSDWDPQLDHIYKDFEVREDTGAGTAWTIEKWVPADHNAWYETYWEHLVELLLQVTERFSSLKEIAIFLDEGWPVPGEHITELAHDLGIAFKIYYNEDG